MNVIIIDDEKRARLNLNLILAEYYPSINVVAECENLPQGVKAIRKFKPQLVLLDIEMPGHSGLELFDFFNEDEIDFSLIFTTAYNEYAIQAFKFSAIDYLLKPIVPEELVNAIKRLEKQQGKLEQIQVLKENFSKEKLTKIAVPSGSSLLFLDTQKIAYLKGDGAYSEVYLIDGTKNLVTRNLKNFEDILCNDERFVRLHKSYIVNLEHVIAFNKADGGSISLSNKTQIPVSADKVDAVLEKIKIIKR